MTVVGLDDTDSRAGMCTTYVAARVGERLRGRGAPVERLLLVRLDPAVEHKTRGNAALAVHTDAAPDEALAVAREAVADLADTDGADTNPAVVVADHRPANAPRRVVEWASAAVRERLAREDALALVDDLGYRHAGWGNARGTVGALAAVGAWASGRLPGGVTNRPDDWTYECIAYRERERWGTPRAVDHDALFESAEAAYPEAWDTVDRATGEAVCVPNTPCPILLGVRGDDPVTVRRVVDRVAGAEPAADEQRDGVCDEEAATRADGTGPTEPVACRALFVTNQGTDAHLRDADLGEVADGGSYRVDGVVDRGPETREGGHVHLRLRDGGATLPAVAFEPTGRFRDRVRALRVGDRVTACGEVTDGTLKLEKFAARSLIGTESAVPRCPECGRSMESAGVGQGYRCRDCGTAAPGKIQRPVERDLEPGWYEVPPSARRHVARPLVRGGFDAPTHPER